MLCALLGNRDVCVSLHESTVDVTRLVQRLWLCSGAPDGGALLGCTHVNSSVLILLCLVPFSGGRCEALVDAHVWSPNPRMDEHPLVQVTGSGRVLVRTTKSSQPHIVKQPSAAASMPWAPCSHYTKRQQGTSKSPARMGPPRSSDREASRRPCQNEEPYYPAAAPA